MGLACHRVSLNYTLVAQSHLPHKWNIIIIVFPHRVILLRQMMERGPRQNEFRNVSCERMYVWLVWPIPEWESHKQEPRQIKWTMNIFEHWKLNSGHSRLLSILLLLLLLCMIHVPTHLSPYYVLVVGLGAAWKASCCYYSKLVFNSWWEIRVFNLWIQSAKLSSQGWLDLELKTRIPQSRRCVVHRY